MGLSLFFIVISPIALVAVLLRGIWMISLGVCLCIGYISTTSH